MQEMQEMLQGSSVWLLWPPAMLSAKVVFALRAQSSSIREQKKKALKLAQKSFVHSQICESIELPDKWRFRVQSTNLLTSHECTLSISPCTISRSSRQRQTQQCCQ